jgi:hypothetical protein
MRKPRPQDYDPDYKGPRRPEPEAVSLEGVVPIKARVTKDDKEPEESERPERPERPERSERVQRGERPERVQVRVIRRRSFDIYIDQYNRLVELKKEAMYRGEERGLAKMVREALDDYLAKEK